MPQDLDVQPFQLDHIRAQKHSGRTTAANLALFGVRPRVRKNPSSVPRHRLEIELYFRCGVRRMALGL
jgi:hypothetical protein